MKRTLGVLTAVLLVAMCAAEAQARGGRGGSHSGFSHRGSSGMRFSAVPHHFGTPHFVHRRVIVGSAFFAAPLLYPGPFGYYPSYYAPDYPVSSDTYYIERSDDLVNPPAYAPAVSSYQYYCPDKNQYYPQVIDCGSGWMTVAPGAEPVR